MTQRMILNETSYFGAGAIKHIVEEITRGGFHKALVVTDKDLVKYGVVSKEITLFDQVGLPYEVYDDVVPNPTIRVVTAGIERYKAAQADYLIAIGGGSLHDTCKAIGIIINNPEYADGVAPTRRPSVPIFAIPTTAGTAAEVTIN